MSKKFGILSKMTASREVQLGKLERVLNLWGVDTQKWGKGDAKAPRDLLTELLEGESTLSITEDGRLLRTCNSMTINIWYQLPSGPLLHLKEDRQEFDDGRVRRRTWLDGSVSEKTKPNENYYDSARRGIMEELGLEINDEISLNCVRFPIRYSNSYPDLLSFYPLKVMDATLNSDQYNPEGYVEKRDRLTTFFVWEPIT